MVAQRRQSAVSGRYQKSSGKPPGGDHDQVTHGVATEAHLLDQDRTGGLQLPGQQRHHEECNRVWPVDRPQAEQHDHEHHSQGLKQWDRPLRTGRHGAATRARLPRRNAGGRSSSSGLEVVAETDMPADSLSAGVG